MEYKHEKAIESIAIVALFIVLILGKLGKVQIQMILGAISFVICILGGIYFIYKKVNLVGVFFFCIAFGLLLVIFSWYYNSYILAVPIPAIFIVISILIYKGSEMSKDNKTIKMMKRNGLIGVILSSIMQVVMIIAFLVKYLNK